MKKFLSNDSGATAIEYALIASMIGLVIVTAVGSVGGGLIGIFNDVAAGF